MKNTPVARPFRYTRSCDTDIRVTFERERKRLAEQAHHRAAADPQVSPAPHNSKERK